MKIINYISIIAMPMVIFIIISEALKERKSKEVNENKRRWYSVWKRRF